MSQTLKQIVKMAKETINSLRIVAGNNDAGQKAQAVSGQKKALNTMVRTNAETAKFMMGETPDLLVACLVLIGPDYFNLDSQARACIAQALEGGKEVVDWDDLDGHVQFTSPVGEWVKNVTSVDIWAAIVELVDGDRSMRYLLSTVATAPAKKKAKSSSAKTNNSLVRLAVETLVDPNATPAVSAKALARISAESSAMVLANTFNSQLDLATPKNRDAVAEHAGHKLELVLDELPDQKAARIIGEMIKVGDVEALVSMVKANAGNVSSVARHLTEDLVGEIFEHDIDLQVKESYVNRLVYIMHTLLVDSSAGYDSGIADYFRSELGQQYIGELAWLAESGDENAAVALRHAQDDLGIPLVDPMDPSENFAEDHYDDDDEETGVADIFDILDELEDDGDSDAEHDTAEE